MANALGGALVIDTSTVNPETSRELSKLGSERAELAAESFASAEEFLKSSQQHGAACLITDIRMPGMSGLAGLDLLRHGRLRQQFFGSTTKVPVSGNRPKDFKSEVLHRSLVNMNQRKGAIEVFFLSGAQGVTIPSIPSRPR